MSLIRRLLKRGVYIYPVDNGLFSNLWLTSTMTGWQAVVNSWRRYGLRVALYNLRIIALGK